MSDVLTVECTGAANAIRQIALIVGKDSMRGINGHIGVYLLEKTRDFLDEMSVSRHKTADRLGAKPTRYLEYASGRSGTGEQRTGLGEVTPSEINIVIRNTPGLKRAFGPLDITPKRAKALTIPLAAESYGRSVAELQRAGHVLFRPKGMNILAESVGPRPTGKRRRKGAATATAELRPMYALVRQVRVPQDRGLLPTKKDYSLWALDAVEGWLESKGS